MAIGFLNAPSLQRSNFQSTATQRDYTNATSNTDTVVEENIRTFVQISYGYIVACYMKHLEISLRLQREPTVVITLVKCEEKI